MLHGSGEAATRTGAHIPEEHVAPWQLRPHAPQLLPSLVVSTQAVPHATMPPVHVTVVVEPVVVDELVVDEPVVVIELVVPVPPALVAPLVDPPLPAVVPVPLPPQPAARTMAA